MLDIHSFSKKDWAAFRRPLLIAPADLTPFEEGDIVRDRFGSLCRIEQIGFLNATSPLQLEAEASIVRHYVRGYTASGRTWTDWLTVEDMTLAETRGVRKFRRFEAWVNAKTPACASA